MDIGLGTRPGYSSATLLGASADRLSLISFNRTITRLRKPGCCFLISCVGAAAVLSYAVLSSQIGGSARPTKCCSDLGVPAA